MESDKVLFTGNRSRSYRCVYLLCHGLQNDAAGRRKNISAFTRGRYKDIREERTVVGR